MAARGPQRFSRSERRLVLAGRHEVPARSRLVHGTADACPRRSGGGPEGGPWGDAVWGNERGGWGRRIARAGAGASVHGARIPTEMTMIRSRSELAISRRALVRAAGRSEEHTSE